MFHEYHVCVLDDVATSRGVKGKGRPTHETL